MPSKVTPAQVRGLVEIEKLGYCKNNLVYKSLIEKGLICWDAPTGRPYRLILTQQGKELWQKSVKN